jgi:hypothetical protein
MKLKFPEPEIELSRLTIKQMIKSKAAPHEENRASNDRRDV